MDALGDRIKSQYEDRTRFYLPRRTYTIIRVDGRAFHTLTRKAKFEKPFSRSFMDVMDRTALALVKEIQGARFAYVQSDEISILATDFSSTKSGAWFDGNVQKIVSIAASVATAEFNVQMATRGRFPVGHFDARVFTIPDPIEVNNYFIWRQQDAERNSVQMLARSLYSHKELLGKNNSQLKELCHLKDKRWEDLTDGEKRGRVVVKSRLIENEGEWIVRGAYRFTGCCDEIHHLIPKHGQSGPFDEEEVNDVKS